MHKTATRKIAALLLLTVFVLCNAPVPVLHTLFADHVDDSIALADEHAGDKVTAAGINCKFAPHVVTTPFVAVAAQQIVTAPDFAVVELFDPSQKITGKTLFHHSLRAPPVLEIS